MRISDWSSDVCSSDLTQSVAILTALLPGHGAADLQLFFALTMYLIGCMLYMAIITLIFYRRSEEHTSELQSLMRISYAVFCLKKKTNTYSIAPIQQLAPQNRINSNNTRLQQRN